MRSAFAHTAEIELAEDGDRAAPGAAITAALCGTWEHEPPCPIASHHTASSRAGSRVRLRVLFACDVDLEDEVRSRIDAALARGLLTGPDGTVSRWSLRDALPGSVQECERADAERLLASSDA
ncbi:hypothetical protein ACQP04_15625 [Pseudonocardia halophobica]|uniref:hypothetical protein n=1 Tax=Pseudonocardia halophobica TaxID=29401 RepID=UPI003D909508